MRWWRLVIGKLSGGGARTDDSLPDVGGPRRRDAERYSFRVQLSAKCSSWPRFEELFSGDVSRNGLFIPTDQEADINEQVQVHLHLPNHERFDVIGRVAHISGPDAPTRGLGVRLDPLEGEPRQKFDEILEAARAAQPRPETAPPGDESAVPRELPVSATGSVSVIAVQETEALAAAPATHRRSDKGPIVGIDLGTTYTSVAAVVDKRVRILAGPNGERSVPSVVAFPDRSLVVVGSEARQRVASDPAHTVASPKRLLGRAYTDREVQTMVGRAPYRTFAGPDGTTAIEMRGQEYAIPQLVGYLFRDIRQRAELQLEREVRRAVCTVPISFDEARVEALRRAASMAQLEIVAVIDEPSSAALANRFDSSFGGVVGVYDFGGGTFDFSIVDVSQGDFRVLATAGDTWLGGDDFDQVLAEAAANQFWRQHKVDLRTQAVEWQRLVFACEQAKRELSEVESSLISVPEVLRTADGMVDLTLRVDRPTLKRASAAIVARTLDVCRQALELVSMKPTQLSCVYLSGGTTHIAAVREELATWFGVPIRTGVPPEHAVCLGAAIHGAQLQLRGATTLTARS